MDFALSTSDDSGWLGLGISNDAAMVRIAEHHFNTNIQKQIGMRCRDFWWWSMYTLRCCMDFPFEMMERVCRFQGNSGPRKIIFFKCLNMFSIGGKLASFILRAL